MKLRDIARGRWPLAVVARIAWSARADVRALPDDAPAWLVRIPEHRAERLREVLEAERCERGRRAA